MDWIRYISQEDIKNTIIALAIFLLFLIIRKLFIKYVYQFVLRISRRSPTQFFTQFFLAYEKPFQWLFVIVGLYIAVDYFPYFDQNNVLFSQLIQSFIVIIAAWGLFNLSGSIPMFFSQLSDRKNLQLDEIVIPFISKGLRLVIVAIAVSIIAQIFNYPIGGLIAGLGLGGLAFALAAQDALANLFGGFVIITERPFSIDDWISTPSVEGIVEDITFRSTKIRTFDQAVVTVPNSTLADEPITNWSEMGKRRVYSTFQLRYNTPVDKMKQAIQRIQDLLESHAGVHPETIAVKVNEFQENGVEIMVYYFTKTTNWGEYLEVKEEIYFAILNILEEEKLSIAIPSRQIYTENDL